MSDLKLHTTTMDRNTRASSRFFVWLLARDYRIMSLRMVEVAFGYGLFIFGVMGFIATIVLSYLWFRRREHSDNQKIVPLVALLASVSSGAMILRLFVVSDTFNAWLPLVFILLYLSISLGTSCDQQWNQRILLLRMSQISRRLIYVAFVGALLALCFSVTSLGRSLSGQGGFTFRSWVRIEDWNFDTVSTATLLVAWDEDLSTQEWAGYRNEFQFPETCGETFEVRLPCRHGGRTFPNVYERTYENEEEITGEDRGEVTCSLGQTIISEGLFNNADDDFVQKTLVVEAFFNKRRCRIAILPYRWLGMFTRVSPLRNPMQAVSVLGLVTMMLGILAAIGAHRSQATPFSFDMRTDELLGDATETPPC